MISGRQRARGAQNGRYGGSGFTGTLIRLLIAKNIPFVISAFMGM